MCIGVLKVAADPSGINVFILVLASVFGGVSIIRAKFGQGKAWRERESIGNCGFVEDGSEDAIRFEKYPR